MSILSKAIIVIIVCLLGFVLTTIAGYIHGERDALKFCGEQIDRVRKADCRDFYIFHEMMFEDIMREELGLDPNHEE